MLLGHVLNSPLTYIGRSYKNDHGNAECVEFVRQTFGAPQTKTWREGIKIVKLNPGQVDPVPVDSAIATFVGGKYPQFGSHHAAIYMGQNSAGLQVLDQWKTKPSVSPRTIFWTHGSSTNLVDNGKAYSVIEW
jgi:hypothetical protein